MQVREIVLHGRDNVIGLQAVETESKGGDQRDGKDNAQPAGVQGTLDIIGGTAFKAAVRFAGLINLGQCTLHKSGSRAQQGHQPHPEGRAGAAHDNGGGDAGHIAGADTGGRGDHQRLEGGDAVVGGFLFKHAFKAVSQQAELYKTGADREVDAGTRQHVDQAPGIEDIVKFSEQFGNSHKNSFLAAIPVRDGNQKSRPRRVGLLYDVYVPPAAKGREWYICIFRINVFGGIGQDLQVTETNCR